MKYILTVIFSVQCAVYSLAQDHISDRITETSIYSSVLNEEREVLIFNSLQKEGVNDLPTIYLLDGKENFLLVSGLVSNLVRAELIPDVNLIGINNYDYEREYNLTTKSESEDIYFETGGASDFESFIIDEVFSYADSSVSTSNYKMLIGHSIGGFFGLNVLIKDPDTFSSAIMVDPSIWWNDAELIEDLKANDQALEGFPIYFSRSGLSEEENSLFDQLESIIKDGQKTFDQFPKENHISTLTPSVFTGLKYLFKDYSVLESLYETAEFSDIKDAIDLSSKKYDTVIIPKVRPLASKARNFTNDGEFEKSIEILSYLEKYHPDDIMVLNFLGEAYEKRGDRRKAEGIYNRSLEIARSKKSPMVRWIENRINAIKN